MENRKKKVIHIESLGTMWIASLGADNCLGNSPEEALRELIDHLVTSPQVALNVPVGV